MGEGVPMKGCMDCLAIIIDSDRELRPSQLFDVYQILGDVEGYEYFGSGMAISKVFHSHFFN